LDTRIKGDGRLLTELAPVGQDVRRARLYAPAPGPRRPLTVLNVRLYRTAWLVAGVALVVALLTLQTPDPGPEPSLPPTIDGQAVLELDRTLASTAPERAAGSGEDLRAARFVQNQLAQVPGDAAPGRRKRQVQVQEFQALRDGRPVALQNVYLVVPGVPDGSVPGGIVVVAPRDTPVGVSGGTSASAVLVRLARASATTRHQRPHLFVSTDGSTIGNAGLRWFLRRFSAFPLSAVIVLDAPGEADGDRVHVWSAGRSDRQTLGLGNLAERSIERVGGRPQGPPGITGQLLRLAVPQTFGEQGAAIAAGLPAVTLSGRSESPLREGATPTAERLALVANAAEDLLNVLDATQGIPAADGSLRFAGKFLRPTIARLALLLLMLPVLVLTLDIVARRRRARAPLADGLRLVALRVVPLGVGLVAAHLLCLGGLLPRPAAGVPPIPADARFGALSGLAIVLAIGAGFLGWRATRRAARRIRVSGAAETAAALAALSVLLVVLWVVSPYALVLAVPAAHAALLASGVRYPWQLPGLVVLLVLPFAALVFSIAGVLNSNALFAGWYLACTAAAGARGAVGLLLGVLVAACVWSIIARVVESALAGDIRPESRRRGPGGGPRRPRRPA
jgi:hypothetical protein